MKQCGSLLLSFSSLCILYTVGLHDNIQVINNYELSDIQIDDQLNPLHFDGPIEKVSAFERDLPSHSAVRVRRQILVEENLHKVRGLTAMQECNGILLKWDRLSLPFSPNRRSVNEEFKHFNIYRSSSNFHNVAGMTPFVSGKLDKTLQNSGTNHFKDLYPPVDTELYYAVTMVNGDGQEDKDVEAKKVEFVASMQRLGRLFKVVPDAITGKVLHHDTAYNPVRNQYFVTFDLDVDNDALPDQIYALRLDTKGAVVDRRMLNCTANIDNRAGNQGWPSVVYNVMKDEYFIAFQFRSGTMQYFSNKFIIISQRVRSWETERAAGPSLLVKANGRGGDPTDSVDSTNPLVKYNSVTGGYVAAAVVNGGRKEVAGLFVDFRGKVLKAEAVCDFKGDAYEPNIFFDSRRNEFYFTCTVASGGVAKADFSLQSGLTMIILTKKDAYGEHASNTENAETKNFVGYTNKTFARTSGYYNELTDRLILFWEDSDSGRHFLKTASILVTRKRYIREVKPYSCLETKRVRSPAAVYFPRNHNHYLFWQEPSASSWAIGGELLQGNLRVEAGREQKDPKLLYNSRLSGAFVSWQEANVVYARQVIVAEQPLCSPFCSSGQKCAVQDTCVSNTGDSCTVHNGGCSHVCTSLYHWKVQCSCPRHMQLQRDGKSCQRAPLPSYSVLVATLTSIWQLFMDTKQNKASFKKVQIGDASMLVAVDYNPVDKRVYWSDVEANKIKRMSVSGVGGVQTLLWNNIGIVDGLTVDSEDDYIYWTDVSNHNIERANLDGRNRKVILSGLDKPRAIILYKQRRSIYWTDWGTTPKIEQANLDGSRKRTIVQGQLKWPNGLVIDPASQKLFWADAGLDKIETSDLRGRGRRVLLSAPHVHHPYSVAILNNRLFWSDWETSGIHSVDKETGDDLMTVAQGLERPSGFVVFKANPPVGERVRCPDPSHPVNGRGNPSSPNDGDGYPQGSFIHYTCFPHFKLHGPVRRTCQSDGSWSNKAPECLALPRFHEIPRSRTVNETERTILVCSTLTPDTTITWFKDGKVVSGKHFVQLERGLLISSAYREDGGWYVCNATNKVGTKLARALLRVLRPLDADCGKPSLTTRGRIIGGTKVEAGTYPWQVSLWNTRAKKHFCGGSLVAERWVVTAAHCVTVGISILMMEVRLGKLFSNKSEPSREQIIRPDRIIIHPQYSSVNLDYDYDIALIHLSSPAVYTDYVIPICLPLRKTDADETLLRPGNVGVITGWGRKRSDGRDILKRMHEVNVPIVSQTSCKRAHQKYIVTSNMFCAGYHNGTLGDACQGDSGGPLAIENSLTMSDDDQRWVLAGIISWGDGCGRIGKYGVYTRVRVFARWINSKISKAD